MNKKLLAAGAILGITGIILGAFAAHGLEKLVDTNAIRSFETGVRYQMYHAFFMIILGATNFVSQKVKKQLLILVLLGVLLFSFSIYGLGTNTLSSFDFKLIAFVTPIGGLLLILAWVLLLVHILKTRID